MQLWLPCCLPRGDVIVTHALKLQHKVLYTQPATRMILAFSASSGAKTDVLLFLTYRQRSARGHHCIITHQGVPGCCCFCFGAAAGGDGAGGGQGGVIRGRGYK